MPFWEVAVPPGEAERQVLPEVQVTDAPEFSPVESIKEPALPAAPAWLFQKLPAMGSPPAVTAVAAIPPGASFEPKFMLMDWAFRLPNKKNKNRLRYRGFMDFGVLMDLERSGSASFARVLAKA
jgi:hypothetical protein